MFVCDVHATIIKKVEKIFVEKHEHEASYSTLSVKDFYTIYIKNEIDFLKVRKKV